MDSRKLCTCCSQVVTHRPLCSAVLTSHNAVASWAVMAPRIIVSTSGLISHSKAKVSGNPTSDGALDGFPGPAIFLGHDSSLVPYVI
jgi:hypothetical protein